MSGRTKIEWATSTFNPVCGCSKVSPGCENCYAAMMAARFPDSKPFEGLARFDAHGRAQWTGKVVLLPERMDEPLHWVKPRRAFVCSTSDLFHADVPDEYLGKVYDVMARAAKHEFIVLTKRAFRMREWYKSFRKDRPAGKNVIIGVTVENQDYAPRIDDLLATPGHIKMVSVEPLLGPLDLKSYLKRGVNWVIVGGESGAHGRPMNEDWVRDIRDACQESGVAFFYKQAIRGREKISFPVLDGKQHSELPDGTSLLTPAPAQTSLF